MSDYLKYNFFPQNWPALGTLPGAVPADESVYYIYDYHNTDSHYRKTIELAEMKQRVAKCLAGNLCRYNSSRRIGRNGKKEECAVYELLNMHRALSSPCISSEQQYAILCKINGYCHCEVDCGCGSEVTLNPPLSGIVTPPGAGDGSDSGGGKGQPSDQNPELADTSTNN